MTGSIYNNPGERKLLAETETHVDLSTMSTYQAAAGRVSAVSMDGVECAFRLGLEVPSMTAFRTALVRETL